MDSTPMDSLDLSHVTVRSISNRRFSILIKVETVENTEEITALIDSGAEGLFIDKSIAHKWRTGILKSPIKVRNVDGTYNENGAIMERCLIPFRINDKIMTEWFYVMALGDQNLILGLPWLEKHNPIIDWTEKTLEFRNSQEDNVTTRYRLLHYANLIRRTGPYCFSFNLLNLATPLLSYAVRLVLLIVVLLSSLPCYLYDAVLILTSDILCSLIDTFLSILRYINSHVFVVEP
jgi:hypothetical protein